jgi:RNA polymerase sigma-70 factor (ECF subfamily)
MITPDSFPDLEARLRAGDQDAAPAVVRRFGRRLAALARRRLAPAVRPRLDPEDVVQSVFRTFFRRAAEGQYAVPEGNELWKLLLVIALNKIRATGIHHHAARRDTRQTTSSGGFEHLLAARPNQGDPAALVALRLVVEDALGALPESQRQVILLRIEGHEVEQIARQTGRAKRSVERILQGFRDDLTRLLQDRV